MTSIRAFVISSSIFLSVWLAASYVTHVDEAAPTRTSTQPTSAEVNLPSDNETTEETTPIARMR